MGDYADDAVNTLMFSSRHLRRRPRQSPAICKYCGVGGLRWKQTTEGYRLARAGEVHSCGPEERRRYREIAEVASAASPDDFEKLA